MIKKHFRFFNEFYFFLKPTQVNKLATVVVTDGTTSVNLNQQLTYDYSSTPVRIFSIFKIILVGDN